MLSDLRENSGEKCVFPGFCPEKHRTRQAVWKDVKRAAKAFQFNQKELTSPGKPCIMEYVVQIGGLHESNETKPLFCCDGNEVARLLKVPGR